LDKITNLIQFYALWLEKKDMICLVNIEIKEAFQAWVFTHWVKENTVGK